LIAMTYSSKIFNCRPAMFNPFFKLRTKVRQTRMLAFRNINLTLMPRIRHETFHQELLSYFKQIVYTFSHFKTFLSKPR